MLFNHERSFLPTFKLKDGKVRIYLPDFESIKKWQTDLNTEEELMYLIVTLEDKEPNYILKSFLFSLKKRPALLSKKHKKEKTRKRRKKSRNNPKKTKSRG